MAALRVTPNCHLTRLSSNTLAASEEASDRVSESSEDNGAVALTPRTARDGGAPVCGLRYFYLQKRLKTERHTASNPNTQSSDLAC